MNVNYLKLICYSAFMQILNSIINGGFNEKAEKVSIPNGLKSTGWDVRLQMLVHNYRGEPVYLWWVDYLNLTIQYCMELSHLGVAFTS